MEKTYILAVDGTEPAHGAARYAREILHDKDELIIVSVADQAVVEDASRFPEEVVKEQGGTSGIRRRLEAQAKQYVEETARLLSSVSFRVDVHTAYGNPGEQLCRIAEQKNAHGIIMGRRGLSPEKELVLGSVSRYVSHHSTCPVIIVPSVFVVEVSEESG